MLTQQAQALTVTMKGRRDLGRLAPLRRTKSGASGRPERRGPATGIRAYNGIAPAGRKHVVFPGISRCL